ncbi:hypothetical protein ADP71_40820 [Vitreoscilla sp. C1]|nr:hypothetical protein ADP71_40820 [Vitreoscilla sp. C1]
MKLFNHPVIITGRFFDCDAASERFDWSKDCLEYSNEKMATVGIEIFISLDIGDFCHHWSVYVGLLIAIITRAQRFQIAER